MSKQPDEQLNVSQPPEEAELLASLLSRYGSDVLIESQRKLDKAELERQAGEILAEMRREAEPEAARQSVAEAEAPSRAGTAEPPPEKAEPEPDAAEEAPGPEAGPEPQKERRGLFVRGRRRRKQAALPQEGEPAEAGPEVSQEAPQAERTEVSQAGAEETGQEAEQAEQKKAQPRVRPEPTREEVLKRAGRAYRSLRRRMGVTFVLTGGMAVLTLLAARGAAAGMTLLGLPLFPALLAAGQAAVMLAGLDVLAQGVVGLLTLRPGWETLLLVCNAAALLDGVLLLVGRSIPGMLPYSVTASASLAFAMLGRAQRYRGERDTARAMGLAVVPTVVIAEDGLLEGGGAVITKQTDGTQGFLRRMLRADLTEQAYRRAMPLALLLLAVLSGGAAVLSGQGGFVRALAAMSGAAAALYGTLCYAAPFAAMARRLIGNGAAVAGWRGAKELERARGLVLRDQDVFPESSIALSGMRVLSGIPAEKAVAFTCSTILAAGSGLRHLFSELMRQFNGQLYRVEEFDCSTEGGVSAFIGKEQVLVGSGAYMNLMGIRVPGNMEVSGAVYTAIEGELAAIFVLQYDPAAQVQRALRRLQTGKLYPIYAIRDFNITPAMLRQRYGLKQQVSFLAPEERYLLSREHTGAYTPAALLSRDGVWHYSQTVRAARRLVRMVRRSFAFTVLGAVLGVSITFLAMAKGAYAAVAPEKLLFSMLLWTAGTMLVAGGADGA